MRRITYRARPDATPEAECAALADIYSMLLNDPENKDGGDDQKEIEHEQDAKEIARE